MYAQRHILILTRSALTPLVAAYASTQYGAPYVNN